MKVLTGLWLSAAGDAIVLNTVSLGVLMGTLPGSASGCGFLRCDSLTVVHKGFSDARLCSIVQWHFIEHRLWSLVVAEIVLVKQFCPVIAVK